MTKIADITTALNALIVATLPGIQKIPNPYEPERNPAMFLTYGYGIGFEDAVNTRREFGQCVTIARTLVIMLLREVAKVDTDAEGVENQAIAILESEISLIKAIELDATLGGAFNVRYTNSSPLEYLLGQGNGVYFRQLSFFGFEYHEQT